MSDEVVESPEPEASGTGEFAEEDLERYVVKESPLRDFVVALLRRAPWWIISFLIHALVLHLGRGEVAVAGG